MNVRNLSRGRRILLFATFTAVCVVSVFVVPRFGQPSGYHSFADTRTLLGIPNALDVLSNLGFLIVGALGMQYSLSRPKNLEQPEERWPYFILFLGVTLTCFGSGYYHLAPDNARLVWDRLPMTLGFMSLFAAILGERINPKFALKLLPVLLLVGIGTVAYWYQTELLGRGDLRPYIMVQFFPIIGIPMLIWLFPGKYTQTSKLTFVVGFYVLAKVLESLDTTIFTLTADTVSGHTLKHIAAAIAVWYILGMLRTRELVTPEQQNQRSVITSAAF